MKKIINCLLLIIVFSFIFFDVLKADTTYLPITYKTVRYNQENGGGTTIWYAVIPAKYKMHYAYGQDKVFGVETHSSNAKRHNATIAVNSQFLGFPIVNGTMVKDGTSVANYDFYIEKNSKVDPAKNPTYAFNVYAVDKFSEKVGISFKNINLGFKYDGNYVPYNNKTIFMSLYNQIVMNKVITNSPVEYITTRHPRTWIAYDSKGNQYVATAAGRNAPLLDGTKLVQTGLNYKEIVDVTKKYMTSDIVTLYNLDGGGSCSFVFKGKKVSPNYDNNNTTERKNYGTFYWKAEDYKIKYDCNGGTKPSGKLSDQIVNETSSFTLSKDLCTKNGYTQTGWVDTTNVIWKSGFSGKWNYTNGKNGIKNYTLTLKAKWEENIIYVAEPKCNTLEYNGKEQVLIKTSKEYTLSNNKAVSAGKYEVTAKLANGYKWKDKTSTDKKITCVILQKDISSSTIEKINNQSYTGKEIKPIPKVTIDLNGTNIVLTTIDYKVSYANNTEAGSGKVIITGTGNYLGTKSTTFTIYKNSNNNLSSLKVNNKSININETNINLEYNNSISSVLIEATPVFSKAKVEGTGTKTLNVGLNSFNIIVTAENGLKKVYTININRKEKEIETSSSTLSNNANLSNIIVTNTNFKFDSNTVYNLEVENQITNVNISAEKEDSKAKVEGTGTKTLKVGLNSFNITVTAENGLKKVYTININRKNKDNKTKNTTKNQNSSSTKNVELKSLIINNKSITLSSGKYIYEYNASYDTKSININILANDKNSKISIEKPDKLVVGTNILKIHLKNGSSQKTYQIQIKKSDGNASTDSSIKALAINDTQLKLEEDKHTYHIVTTSQEKLKIDYVLGNEKSNIEITGNENIKNGSVVSLLVTAEDGSKSRYNLSIEVKDESFGPLEYVSFGIIVIGILLSFMSLFKKK